MCWLTVHARSYPVRSFSCWLLLRMPLCTHTCAAAHSAVWQLACGNPPAQAAAASTMLWTQDMHGTAPHYPHLRGFSARAVNTFVGPMSSRHPLMASGLARTIAQMGPLVMKSTSLGKNGFPKCSP